MSRGFHAPIILARSRDAAGRLWPVRRLYFRTVSLIFADLSVSARALASRRSSVCSLLSSAITISGESGSTTLPAMMQDAVYDSEISESYLEAESYIDYELWLTAHRDGSPQPQLQRTLRPWTTMQ